MIDTQLIKSLLNFWTALRTSSFSFSENLSVLVVDLNVYDNSETDDSVKKKE